MRIIKHTGHETNTSCIDSMKRHSLWCALCQHATYTIIDETLVFYYGQCYGRLVTVHCIITFSPLFPCFFALQQKNVVSHLVASLSVSLLSSLPAPVWRTEADWALRGVSMGKPFYDFYREGKSAFQTDAGNKFNLHAYIYVCLVDL